MRSSDFHSNPLFLLLVIFSNKLHFGLKFSVLEIFFGKFIQNQLNSLFMLALKTEKSHTKIFPCMFWSDIFCSMNSKSAIVWNFQILLVFIHKKFRKKPNNKQTRKPQAGHWQIESLKSFKFQFQDVRKVLSVFQEVVGRFINGWSGSIIPCVGISWAAHCELIPPEVVPCGLREAEFHLLQLCFGCTSCLVGPQSHF